jgi:hypothetical protein
VRFYPNYSMSLRNTNGYSVVNKGKRNSIIDNKPFYWFKGGE